MWHSVLSFSLLGNTLEAFLHDNKFLPSSSQTECIYILQFKFCPAALSLWVCVGYSRHSGWGLLGHLDYRAKARLLCCVVLALCKTLRGSEGVCGSFNSNSSRNSLSHTNSVTTLPSLIHLSLRWSSSFYTVFYAHWGQHTNETLSGDKKALHYSKNETYRQALADYLHHKNNTDVTFF